MAANYFFHGSFPRALLLIGQYLGPSDVVRLRYITPRTTPMLRFGRITSFYPPRFGFYGVLEGSDGQHIPVDFSACGESAEEYTHMVLQRLYPRGDKLGKFLVHFMIRSEAFAACLRVIQNPAVRARYALSEKILREACTMTAHELFVFASLCPRDILHSFTTNREIRITRSQFKIAVRRLLSGWRGKDDYSTADMTELVRLTTLLRQFSIVVDERLDELRARGRRAGEFSEAGRRAGERSEAGRRAGEFSEAGRRAGEFSEAGRRAGEFSEAGRPVLPQSEDRARPAE
jgi:hypothetical protein